MVRIGLTGGIAAGKSTASAAFMKLGAVVIDYDQLSHDAVSPGSPILAEIAQVFGAGALHDDGSLNRQKIAELIFNNDGARRQLEQLVHPRVFQLAAQIERRAKEENPCAIIIHDIPLLVEKGLASDFDAVVIVQADEEVRRRRLIETRGLSDAEARARITAGASDGERQAAGTIFLSGNGSPERLETGVQALWGQGLLFGA